jgi:hypothetical protein
LTPISFIKKKREGVSIMENKFHRYEEQIEKLLSRIKGEEVIDILNEKINAIE